MLSQYCDTQFLQSDIYPAYFHVVFRYLVELLLELVLSMMVMLMMVLIRELLVERGISIRSLGHYKESSPLSRHGSATSLR